MKRPEKKKPACKHDNLWEEMVGSKLWNDGYNQACDDW